MRRSVYILVMGFIMCACLGHAQQRIDDSLRKVLKTPQNDTNRIITLSNLAWDLTNSGGNHEADSLAHLALAMSEKLGYSRGVYKAYNSLGGVCWALTDYPGAMVYFNKSLEAARKWNNQLAIANCISHIASIFQLEGNLPEALKNDLASLSIYEKENNLDGEDKLYNNIGNVYTEEGNVAEAMRYYKMSEDISFKQHDKYGIEGATMNLGIDYLMQHKYDSALVMFNECLAIGKELNDLFDIGETYSNMGVAYDGLGKHDEAFQSMFKSLSTQRQIDNKRGVCSAYTSIGELYYNAKKYPLAKVYYDSALAIAKMAGVKIYDEGIYKNYSSLDSAMCNYMGAYDHYKQYIVYRDSVKSEANTKKLVQEQMQYDFDKKETVQKAEQDKKDVITEGNSKRQKLTILFMALIALAVGVIAVVILRSLRITRKQKVLIELQKQVVEEQKELVEQQKAIVDEKNKDITDSIHYASRIQRALLTTDEYISKHIKDHFILFKPRDIVSGDFYWALETAPSRPSPLGKETEDLGGAATFLICAGDCTGHGVPGAFMSLLNISLLNEIAVERKVHAPNEILDEVREHIVKALNADGDEKGSKDGMDCVLASLHPSKGGMTLEYAAAYNAPLIIRNGEALEGEADKMPVGVFTGVQRPFTLHTVELQKGDCIYLFTDGYADQFGGPKGKKFKYKQLQQLLIDNVQLTMAKQKQLLEKTIEEWKGGLEQIDDILVIGIRV